MPKIDGARLKKLLSEGYLPGLYVIAGEEKHSVKKAAQALIAKASGKMFPEFNSNEFGNEALAEDIGAAVEALPFMAEHKCVSVSDYNMDEKSGEELQRICEMIEEVPETTTLVFWYPTLEPGGKNASGWKTFLKKAEAVGNVVLFGRKKPEELQKLMMRQAAKEGCVLSRSVAEKIVEYAGQDLNLLEQEIGKLSAFALGSWEEGGRQGEAEITADMVESLTCKTPETTSFLMANAVVAGNYEKAYSLLDVLFYQKIKSPMILGALCGPYVDMYRMWAAKESGRTSSALLDYGEYKGREFCLRNAERNIRSLSKGAVRKSLNLLMEADMAIKGSPLDDRVIFEELIAKLLLAREEEKR